MSAFNWVMIGAGKLAHIVAGELLPSGRHKIVSVYTHTWDKCRAVAAETGAAAARTAEEAIRTPGVDGVYIVTPHNSHFEYAKLALSLGKPVLCEKPVTTDAGQAAELIRLARQNRVYFTEGMWTWFSPIANQVKAWLDEGRYGEIESLLMTYHRFGINYAPRLSDPNLAGGALLDCGIYPVTYLYRLFGKPLNVRCTGTLRDGIDIMEKVEMTFPSGQRYTADISMVDEEGLENLVIRGSRACTELPDYHFAQAVTLCPKDGEPVTVRGNGSLLNEFDWVAEEIRAGRTESRFVPHQATLDVMEILDECRKQMGLRYPFEL